MNDETNPVALAGALSRRRAIAGIAVAFGGLTAGGTAMSETTNEAPGAAAKQTRTALHFETDFAASRQHIYEVLLDPKQFAAMTAQPATIDAKEGGAFTMFGGRIVGRHVELISGQRIVQAWRPTHWDAGIYSIVKFEFREHGLKTTLLLDHTGFPAAEADHLEAGWTEHYLDPLAKYFA